MPVGVDVRDLGSYEDEPWCNGLAHRDTGSKQQSAIADRWRVTRVLRAALGLLPILLKCPAALVLRLVKLAVAMQLAQGIVAGSSVA